MLPVWVNGKIFLKSIKLIWKKLFAHLISLLFLSRAQHCLQHWLWAEDKWRCVRALYQPTKNLQVILMWRLVVGWTGAIMEIVGWIFFLLNGWPIKSMTSLSSVCLRQDDKYLFFPLLSSLKSKQFVFCGLRRWALLAYTKMIWICFFMSIEALNNNMFLALCF